MTKREFLEALEKKLSQLPPEERQKQLEFYAELLSDKMEEGMSEQEAVADLGSVEDIASSILQEMPLSKLVKSRVKPSSGWTVLSIVLLVLGLPIWLPLCIVFVALVVTVYVVIWCVIIALIATFIGVAIGVVALFIIAFVSLFRHLPAFFLILGCALLCAGLCVLAFIVIRAAIKGLVLLTKSIGRGIKSLFIKKE